MQFNTLLANADGLDLEVDSDSGDVTLLVLLVTEAHEYVGLAHATIADDDHLDEVVVSGSRRFYRTH